MKTSSKQSKHCISQVTTVRKMIILHAEMRIKKHQVINIYFEKFLIQSIFLCSKLLVASVHLHQSSKVKRFIIARTTSPCAIVFLILKQQYHFLGGVIKKHFFFDVLAKHITEESNSTRPTMKIYDLYYFTNVCLSYCKSTSVPWLPFLHYPALSNKGLIASP